MASTEMSVTKQSGEDLLKGKGVRLSRRSIWKPNEVKVANIELFFDLIFAVALKNTTHALPTDRRVPTASQALTFLDEVFLLWWIWHNGAIWCNVGQMYGGVKNYHALFIFIFTAGAAVTSMAEQVGAIEVFFAGILAVRLLQTLGFGVELWDIQWRYGLPQAGEEEPRPPPPPEDLHLREHLRTLHDLFRLQIGAMALVEVPLLAAAVILAALRWAWQSAAVGLALALLIFVMRIVGAIKNDRRWLEQRQRPNFAVDHLTARYRRMVLIQIGTTVSGSMAVNPTVPTTHLAVVMGAILFVGFAMYLLYFETPPDQSKRGSQVSYTQGMNTCHAHVFLLLSMILAG